MANSSRCSRGPVRRGRRKAHQISALAFAEDTELWLHLAPPMTPWTCAGSTASVSSFCTGLRTDPPLPGWLDCAQSKLETRTKKKSRRKFAYRPRPLALCAHLPHRWTRRTSCLSQWRDAESTDSDRGVSWMYGPECAVNRARDGLKPSVQAIIDLECETTPAQECGPLNARERREPDVQNWQHDHNLSRMSSTHIMYAQERGGDSDDVLAWDHVGLTFA